MYFITFDVEQLKLRQMKKAEKQNARLAKEYRKAINKMKKEIDSWYARFSKENGLSLVDARRILNNRELKDFKMTLKEYVKKAKDKNMSEDHRLMLENASIRKRLDRSQMIYIQLAQLMEELATTNKEELADILADVYEDSYYRSAYTVQRRTRYQNLNALPDDEIKKVIQQPWAADGKEFSARIWQDRRMLVTALEHELAYSLLAGKGTTYMAEAIERRMGTSYRNAKRLVETEVAYIHERAILDMYDELDVEKLQIIATLDSKTSQVCRSLDKTVINKEDAVPGKTVPPFHCYCRSTTAPYFEGLDGEVRAARDENGKTDPGENGKTVYVDGDLSYEMWYNKYVPEKPLLLKDAKDVEKHFGEDMKKWVDGLTSAETDSIQTYSLSDYRGINSYTRKKKEKLQAFTQNEIQEIKAWIGGIDSALGKYELTKPVRLYRGTILPYKIDKSKIGIEYSDDAFSSFSVSEDMAYSFINFHKNGNYVLFEVDMPKGKGHGAFIQNISGFSDEAEFLAARGKKFIIKDVKELRDKKSRCRYSRVRLEVVKNDD